jgi:hypothetical protein
MAASLLPLHVYWNGTRSDNFTTTPGQGVTDAQGAGYTHIRTTGYVFQGQVAGTVPLNLYWNGSRNDNYVAAHPQGQKDATDAGYTFIRTLGYVYPEGKHPAGTVPLKVFWSGARSDNYSCADAQGESDALGAGYNFIRNDCFVMPHNSPIFHDEKGHHHGHGHGHGHFTPESLADTGKRVHIESAFCPMLLHVHGGVYANGTKLTIWDKAVGHQLNLQWTIAKAPEGYYLQSCGDSAFVAHQHGGNNDNGSPCTIWDSRAAGKQQNLQVRFTPRGGDLYSIHFVHSNKCIHVHGGVAANGTDITQWEYVDQLNLKWRFSLV